MRRLVGAGGGTPTLHAKVSPSVVLEDGEAPTLCRGDAGRRAIHRKLRDANGISVGQSVCAPAYSDDLARGECVSHLGARHAEGP